MVRVKVVSLPFPTCRLQALEGQELPPTPVCYPPLLELIAEF